MTNHGPLQKLEENLWAVEGEVPGLPFRRRMSIAKRADGKLLFFNAMPLEESVLSEVKVWGEPSVLIVPHDQHMIDAGAFAEKLGLKVFGPKECETKMRERTDVSGTLDAVPPDPSIHIEPVAGVKDGEPALVVKSPGGRTSLLFADVIMNNAKQAVGLALTMRSISFSDARCACWMSTCARARSWSRSRSRSPTLPSIPMCIARKMAGLI